MRNLKKIITAVLTAAMITTCTPASAPSVSYAAGPTDFASATDVELNQVNLVTSEGIDPATEEPSYVWYRFHASPETEIELVLTTLEISWLYCDVYDSALQHLAYCEGSTSKTIKLGKDTTYYIRLNSQKATKGSFTVKGTNEPVAEPTVEPTAVPTVEPTAEPTIAPTAEPTAAPTPEPTAEPIAEPTAKPTPAPVVEPTAAPTVAPTSGSDIGNIDSDFWTENDNTGSSVYDEELPVPEIKEVENSGKNVNIVWSCSNTSDIDGYYIYRSKDGKTWNKIATINDTEIEDYEDTDVANGEGYGYIMRSYVDSSQSENSIPEYTCFLNRISVKSVKSKASKKLTIKWSTNSKASGYQIRISTTKSFTKTTTEMKKITSTAKNTKTIGRLKGGKKYHVQARAYRSYNGEIYYSEWSPSKSLKVKR